MVEIPDIPYPPVLEERLRGKMNAKFYAAARYQWQFIFCPLCGHNRLVHNQMPKGVNWWSIEEVKAHNATGFQWQSCTVHATTWCHVCRLELQGKL